MPDFLKISPKKGPTLLVAGGVACLVVVVAVMGYLGSKDESSSRTGNPPPAPGPQETPLQVRSREYTAASEAVPRYWKERTRVSVSNLEMGKCHVTDKYGVSYEAEGTVHALVQCEDKNGDAVQGVIRTCLLAKINGAWKVIKEE